MSKTCTASVPTLAALFLPVALLLIPNCTGQGKAKPWTSKQIAAAVAKFEAHVKAKADKDAVEVLDEIILAAPAFAKKRQRAGIAKKIGLLLTARKLKRDPKQAELYLRIARALGSLGDVGSPMLIRAVEHKKFKGKVWDSLRGQFLEQVGVTKVASQKAIKLLIDTSRREDSDVLRRSAGSALRHFSGAPLKTRREIAKQMIREFVNIHGNANTLPGADPRGGAGTIGVEQRQRSVQRLAAVDGAWTVMLQKLTKQSISAPPKWQSFYNDKKAWNANWDAATSGKKSGKKPSKRRK